MKSTRSEHHHSNQKSNSETWVRFTCPQGHRLKANQCFAGQTVVCPTCGGKAEIPLPAANPITDTGALRLLEAAELATAAQEEHLQATRACPRCGENILASASMCSHCRLYMFPSEAWKSFVRATQDRDKSGK
jgi:predicted RNA-binding Zn-ribbon protein involved in translation (DUF1610 family)